MTMQIDLSMLGLLQTNLSAQQDILNEYLAVLTAIDAPPDTDFLDADRLALLKFNTLFVFELRLDIACFPLTGAAVVFYGSDNTPIPLDCLS